MRGRDAGDAPEYTIYETEEFARRPADLSGTDREAIRRKLDTYAYPQLRMQPFYGVSIRELRGYRPETWRYRIGRCRAFYIADQEKREIWMLTLDARKDAYR